MSPGPVSDSFDPEFGTADNARTVVEAIDKVRDKLTRALGTDELQNILAIVNGRSGWRHKLYLTERELRVLRFAIDRAKETI